jgi:hypothetical protein
MRLAKGGMVEKSKKYEKKPLKVFIISKAPSL